MVFPHSRSEIMQAIKSKGNKSTEIRLLLLFRENGIKGWRRHLPLPGKPDFAFPREKLAIFVDGCFWHGCPRCYRRPRKNVEYWDKKIGGNQRRDRKNNRLLRKKGWKVARVWECRLKKPEAAIVRILRMLSCKKKMIEKLG
tara:strand:- start:689 stop:1114 length:426 start_codon:yes stop_codon:yes gene_type:complete